MPKSLLKCPEQASQKQSLSSKKPRYVKSKTFLQMCAFSVYEVCRKGVPEPEASSGELKAQYSGEGRSMVGHENSHRLLPKCRQPAAHLRERARRGSLSLKAENVDCHVAGENEEKTFDGGRSLKREDEQLISSITSVK